MHIIEISNEEVYPPGRGKHSLTPCGILCGTDLAPNLWAHLKELGQDFPQHELST